MRPSITVVGLGPAGGELIDESARQAIIGADLAFLRTSRHPGASAFGDLASFDHHYEAAATFDEVYDRIVTDLVTAAQVASTDGRSVVYAVPGSPLVAERTVVMLRRDPRIDVTVLPAPSFLDLAWARLAIDPVDAGARLVDGTRFAVEAAGDRGPLLVAQCWSPAVLSEIKLAFEDAGAPGERSATVLHHLGLPDEVVATVPWHELDRAVVPDHLTSVWIPALAAPVGSELVALEELARRLRAQCPWDRVQTHGSLSRYLLEECYEVIDAIDGLDAIDAIDGSSPDDATQRVAVEHFEEELGDLLFQVYFHSRLAAEKGWFSLADVARGVHDKLVSRHPHVFGDVVAHGEETVRANWEAGKKREKGRQSVTDGIPPTLPALALASQLQRKASSVPGAPAATPDQLETLLHEGVTELAHASTEDYGEGALPGDLLWALADLLRQSGAEPEGALRAAAGRFAAAVRLAEQTRLPGEQSRLPGEP